MPEVVSGDPMPPQWHIRTDAGILRMYPYPVNWLRTALQADVPDGLLVTDIVTYHRLEDDMHQILISVVISGKEGSFDVKAEALGHEPWEEVLTKLRLLAP
jgi:hypothetical protein